MTDVNPADYKLPFELCEKFRAVNDRTQALTNLDVRLGFEQVMDDPQFVATAEARGQRFAVPEYVWKILANWVNGTPLDLEGVLVPDEVQAWLLEHVPDWQAP